MVFDAGSRQIQTSQGFFLAKEYITIRHSWLPKAVSRYLAKAEAILAKAGVISIIAGSKVEISHHNWDDIATAKRYSIIVGPMT